MTSRIQAAAVLGCVLSSLVLSAHRAEAQVTLADPNFVVENIYSGNGMVTMEFGPGGRLYVCEKRGRVLVLQPNGSGGYSAPTVFLDLTGSVAFEQESGLLGMALDPDFANTRHMFLFHSTTTDQRIIRVTADASFNTATAGSSTVILSGFPRNVGTHKAGDIHFAPNDPDHLYVVLGDDGGPIYVQDTSRYNGKILKISKVDGAGLATNPFQNGNLQSVQSRIWAIGMRNPFRFTFHPLVPHANVLYVSENGNQTDRITRVTMGGDGSWNFNGDAGGFLNPPDQRVRVMNTQQPFLTGIAIVRGGPFGDPADPNMDVLYVANGRTPGTRGSIQRYRLTGANLDTLQAVPSDNGQTFALGITGIDMKIGPDGAMYLTNTATFESAGTTYALNRIRRVGGSPPSAAFTTNPMPARGAAPFSVTFTDGSSDPDGSIASWAWDFGDGTTSTQRSPTHTFQNAGAFTVQLTVTDNTGLRAQVSQTVTAVHAVNFTLRGHVYDGRDLLGNGAPSAETLSLYQLDGTTPASFTGGLGARNNQITVPAGGVINATAQVELTGDGLVVSAGEGSADFKAAYTGFVVSAAAAMHTQDLSFWLSNTAIRGRVRDTRMTAAQTDIGIARSTEGQLYAFAGGRDYLPASGIPATNVNHRTVSDAFGYYYIPIRPADGGAVFLFGVVADTNRDVYSSAGFTEMIATNQLVTHDITLGLKQGGGMCDDLAGIAPTPAVDYSTQIQPIWDANCTGCHNSATGNANLTLEAPSWRRIVSVPSLEVPGKNLIEPGSPAASFLFEKLNCANPQIGTQMRPLDRLPLAQQQLIVDWITQGALEVPNMSMPDGGVVDVDGGAPSDDGGVTPGMDATVTPGMDATVVPGQDASAPGQDAGTPGPSGLAGSGAKGGCGCAAVPPIAEGRDLASIFGLAVLALGLFARRRA